MSSMKAEISSTGFTKFRMAVLFLTAMVMAACLQGCGEEQARKSPIQISVWMDASDKEAEFYRRAARSFEESRKNEVSISLEFIRLNDLKPRLLGAMPGKGPDLLLLVNDWVGELAEKGILRTIDSVLNEPSLNPPACEESPSGNLNPKLPEHPSAVSSEEFHPAGIEAMRHSGKLYAIPRNMEVAALIFNKAFFPVPPESFEYVETTAPKLKKDGIWPLLYDNHNFYYHALFLHGFGGAALVEGKPALTSEASIKAVKFALDMQKRGVVHPKSSYYSAIGMFCTGRAASIIAGPWSMEEIAASGIDFGLTLLPGLPDGKTPRPFLGVKGFGITSFSSHSKICLELAENLTSFEMQRRGTAELYLIPARKIPTDSLGKDSEWVRVFLAQAEQSEPMQNHPAMIHVWKEMYCSLHQILTEGMKPEISLERAQAAIITAMKGN